MEKNESQVIRLRVNSEEKEMFDFLKTKGYAVTTIIKIALREKAVAQGYQSKKEERSNECM